MTPRYQPKKDRSGDWNVLDTQTSRFVATGLDEQDAKDGAQNRNDEWQREVESRGGAA